MTAPEPCIHDLVPETCADCRPREPRRLRPHRPPVQARWPGTCRACGEDIRHGDAIVRDDDDVTWIHEECA